MNQDLLAYFDRELKFLAEDAVEFGRQNPTSAGLLDPNNEAPRDPHVERFIQGLAMLNADLQMKLDGSLPDAADFLLNSMFPHMKQPVPSMTIVQFEEPTENGAAEGGVSIPAGTSLTSEPHREVTCQFQTCYSLDYQPFEVHSAKLTSPRSNVIRQSSESDQAATLSLKIRSTRESSVDGATVRCFLNGARQITFPLYELLVNHATRVVVRCGNEERTIAAGPGVISAVGFNRSEAALPWPSRSDDAFRVLTEFFHFPEKFLFVDLPAWDMNVFAADEGAQQFDVLIHFDRAMPSIESQITQDNFLFNCTPAVNTFRTRAEPVRLTHDVSEYPVEADLRGGVDILTIDQVTALSETDVVSVPEFFQPSPDLSDDAASMGPFWVGRRGSSGGDGRKLSIAVADPAFRLMEPDTWVLDINATCLNSDLPSRLPYRGTGPVLHPENVSANCHCVVAPTVSRSPQSQAQARRSLNTLLTLRYLPLVDDRSGHSRILALLQQHDHSDSAEIASMINGLTGASIAEAFEEIFVDRTRAFCHGAEITVRLDQSRYPGGSSYLFSSALSEFLARSCSFNSFCRLTVEARDTGDVIHFFPAAAGEQRLQPA